MKIQIPLSRQLYHRHGQIKFFNVVATFCHRELRTSLYLATHICAALNTTTLLQRPPCFCHTPGYQGLADWRVLAVLCQRSDSQREWTASGSQMQLAFYREQWRGRRGMAGFNVTLDTGQWFGAEGSWVRASGVYSWRKSVMYLLSDLHTFILPPPFV